MQLTAPPELAPAPVNADLLDRVMHATLVCVTRNGFDRTTIDNIVQESGVPRTTIYRNIGNRDALLQAMLTRMALPHQKRCLAVASGSGSWDERLEKVLALSVANMAEYPWLQEIVRQGLSESSFALFESVSRSIGGNVLRTMLERQQEEAGWPDDVSIDELIDWTLRQVLFLGARARQDADEIRRYIRTFVLPIFLVLERGRTRGDDLEQRVARLEQAIATQPGQVRQTSADQHPNQARGDAESRKE